MRINEADSVGWSAIKHLGRKLVGSPDASMSLQDKMAKDEFVKSFLSKLTGALNSQISSGMVSTTAQSTPQQPAAPAATPTQQQPQQPNPTQVRQAKQKTAAASAQKQMTPAPQRSAAPTPSNIRQQRQATATQAARSQMGIKENKFQKLNDLFESILNEQEQTISQYVQQFVLNYLKHDINVQDPEFVANISKMAKEVESTYARDRGKAAFAKLANYAYGVAASGGQQSQQQPQARPTAPTAVAPTLPKEVIDLLDKLTPEQKQQAAAHLSKS